MAVAPTERLGGRANGTARAQKSPVRNGGIFKAKQWHTLRDVLKTWVLAIAYICMVILGGIVSRDCSFESLVITFSKCVKFDELKQLKRVDLSSTGGWVLLAVCFLCFRFSLVISCTTKLSIIAWMHECAKRGNASTRVARKLFPIALTTTGERSLLYLSNASNLRSKMERRGRRATSIRET